MEKQKGLPEGFYDRPASMADLEAALELFNLCSREMTGENEFTKTELQKEWTTPGFNQETDQRVVLSPEGKLIAYQEVWAVNKPPVHPWVWGRVHPDYEGLGLGTYLLQWGENRSRQVIDQVPAEARVAFISYSNANHQPGNDLLSGYGMKLFRQSFEMRIDLNDAPPPVEWPEGFTMRTYRPGDAEAVYRADDEAFQDHFGYVPEDFETGFKKFKHYLIDTPSFEPKLWFLAYDGDEIAGVCLCRIKNSDDEQLGWVSSLAVRRPWRKRGLGLALLRHSFGAFWKRDIHQVGLGVDAKNLTGALRLYEKAGMYIHRQYNKYEKELRSGKEISNTGETS